MRLLPRKQLLTPLFEYDQKQAPWQAICVQGSDVQTLPSVLLGCYSLTYNVAGPCTVNVGPKFYL